MARIARVVLPDYPHHVTQRGNRRQLVFFSDEDYRTYRTMLAKACRMARTEVWAYCLMPNHVHLILVPSRPDGLRAALGEAHRRYTRRINFRGGVSEKDGYDAAAHAYRAPVGWRKLYRCRRTYCGQGCTGRQAGAETARDVRVGDMSILSP
jgi:putative transposase